MPELPEVETTRRDLICLEGSMLGPVKADRLTRDDLAGISNRKLIRMRRRGKYLVFDFVDRALVVHLGMSGRLFLSPEAIEHRHLRWSLPTSLGSHLNFVDRRRFGRFRVVSADAWSCAFPGISKMGPEPLSRGFTAQLLHASARDSRRTIKTLLLDQTVVAGLGNIYADEVLFDARVHPSTVGVTEKTSAVIVLSIKRVLRAAIAKRGASFSLHRDGLIPAGAFTEELKVFGRAGQGCFRCDDTITKITLSSRGTHLCRTCQPLRSN